MSTSADFYVCITIDIALITATEDRTNNTDRDCLVAFGIKNGDIRISSVRIFTGIFLANSTCSHVDIDMRRTYQFSHITTTVYFTYLRCRDNINMWVTGRRGQCSYITFLVWNTLLHLSFFRIIINIDGISVFVNNISCRSRVTIDRIWCEIATGIQLINHDRCTTVFFYVNRDRSCDCASRFVTAKYLRIVAISDTDMYII